MEDPRFTALLEALAEHPRLAKAVEDRARSTAKRKFGGDALKLNGKIFAMHALGTLVVKLPKKRVDELVASGVGKYFDPGHGRLMKQWLAVQSDGASWTDLAIEAHDYVHAAR